MRPTYSQLSQIKWGKSYLWYVRILEKNKAPIQFGAGSSFSQFQGWVPAESVTEQVWNMATTPINIPIFPFELPKGRASNLKLSMTLYDDELLSIATFMGNWVDNILGIKQSDSGIGTVNKGMLPIVEMTKWIEVVKLGERRGEIHRNYYEVIPMGEFKLSHNSSSEVIKHNLSFNVITSQLNVR